VVFRAVFPPAGAPAAPLSAAARQLLNLRLVCRAWAAALCAAPPPLRLGATCAPARLLCRWLACQRVHELAIAPGADAAWAEGDAEDAAEDAGGCGFGGGGFLDKDEDEFVDACLALECVEGAGRALWSAAALTHLRALAVAQPRAWRPRAALAFDAAPLAALLRLERLALSGFTEYRLPALPPRLRRLSLEFAGRFVDTAPNTHGISVLRLPPGARLEKLRVAKDGVLGLALDEAWDAVADVALRGTHLLLAVPVGDDGFVHTFRRPYVEGDYVPPHILADMNAVEESNGVAEATASWFLEALAARAGPLRRLAVAGGAAASVKLVPAPPGGGAEAVAFLHRVTQDAKLDYLFGHSGAELAARAAAMRLFEPAEGRRALAVDVGERRFALELGDRAPE
jgi:hypothetical protein